VGKSNTESDNRARDHLGDMKMGGLDARQAGMMVVRDKR
jgi:hypothetical protein